MQERAIVTYGCSTAAARESATGRSHHRPALRPRKDGASANFAAPPARASQRLEPPRALEVPVYRLERRARRRARPHARQCGVEVARRDLRRAQVLVQGGKRGLAANRGDVSAGAALGGRSERAHIHVGRGRRRAEVHPEHLRAAGGVGRRHVQQAVEAAGAQQSRVDAVRPVCGGKDDHAKARLQPVQLHQQLRQHALAGAAGVAGAGARPARAREAVKLVEEDNRGRGGARACKERRDSALRAADPL
jgi:hypothetical protein